MSPNLFVPSLLEQSTPAMNTSPNLVLPSHDLPQAHTSTVRLLGTHPRLQLIHERWLSKSHWVLLARTKRTFQFSCWVRVWRAAETEGSAEAASRSTPSGDLRTQEEPCWEQQARPQGREVSGKPRTEWTVLEARNLPLPTSGWSLAGSAPRQLRTFIIALEKTGKPRGISE